MNDFLESKGIEPTQADFFEHPNGVQVIPSIAQENEEPGKVGVFVGASQMVCPKFRIHLLHPNPPVLHVFFLL